MTSYRSLLWPNLQFSSRLDCTIGSGVVELVGIKLYFIENKACQGEIETYNPGLFFPLGSVLKEFLLKSGSISSIFGSESSIYGVFLPYPT